jgi:hypothetical protein
MNLKPLYIHATRPYQVKLTQPALCVKTNTKANRYYPLKNIERIQVSGPVEWDTAALLACAESKISVQFVNAQGETRGRLVGAGKINHSLPENLQRLINSPGWEARYRQWCWARSLQTQRYAADRLGYSYREVRDFAGLPKWSEARLTNQTKCNSARKALQWLHGDLYGFVTQYLQNSGVWNSSPLMLEEPIDLARDITSILQWILLVVRQREFKADDNRQAITHRHVAGWFTHNRGYMKYQVARMINLLEIWIVESS